MSARVIFFTRQDCHLCDEARIVVEQVCKEKREPWQVVDVDTVPGLKKKYGELVPVVMVDSEQIGFWTIEADKLRHALG